MKHPRRRQTVTLSSISATSATHFSRKRTTIANSTPQSRLEVIRRKTRKLTQEWDAGGVEVKLRSYSGIKVRPTVIDTLAENFARFFRLGMRGPDLWYSVIAAHPEATKWELAVAGGKTARRIFTDHRMRQSYRYQEQSVGNGAA